MNELLDRTVRTEECVTNKIPANTLRETEYRLDEFRATNGAHIEIYRVHEKLCGPVFENVSISRIHFVVEDIRCFIPLSF